MSLSPSAIARASLLLLAAGALFASGCGGGATTKKSDAKHSDTIKAKDTKVVHQSTEKSGAQEPEFNTEAYDRIYENDFLSPVKEADIVTLNAEVRATFRTSMEVTVEVWGENPLTGERRLTCTAILTLVAIGDDGRPTPVPPLRLETDEERAHAQEAQARRAKRLARIRS